MPKRVLIVEDDEDERELLSMLLQSCGYDVVEASDGYEGLEKAVGEYPDIILMDIRMPELDGLETTKLIRSYDELDDIAVIAVTGFSTDYKDKAINAGCSTVFDKPIDILTLEPILKQYIH